MGIKNTIYQFLVEGNTVWMRLFLISTAFLTALIMVLPFTFHPSRTILFLDPELVNITWFGFFIAYAILGTINLTKKATSKFILLVESIYGFVLFSVASVYSVIVYEFAVATAPLIMSTFLAWCILAMTVVKKW